AGGLVLNISGCYFKGLGNLLPGIGCIDLYDFLGRSTLTSNRFWDCTGVAIKTADSSALVIQGAAITRQAFPFNAAAVYYSGAVHGYGTLPYPDVVIGGVAVREWASGYGIHLVGDGTTPADLSASDLHVRGIQVSNCTLDGCASGIYADGIAD